jgi:hypothetical protein
MTWAFAMCVRGYEAFCTDPCGSMTYFLAAPWSNSA